METPIRPPRVFHYQYGHKLMAHGTLCPWCKDFTMIHETMELAYRIRSDKVRTQYHKLNWDWVCSRKCKDAMEAQWRMALTPAAELARKIERTPELVPIEIKTADGYRETALKLSRLDPGTHLPTEIIHFTNIF